MSDGYAVFTNQDNSIRTPTSYYVKPSLEQKNVGTEMLMFNTHYCFRNIVKQVINVRTSTFQIGDFGANGKWAKV